VNAYTIEGKRRQRLAILVALSATTTVGAPGCRATTGPAERGALPAAQGTPIKASRGEATPDLRGQRPAGPEPVYRTDVADLLAEPPAPGKQVDIDAYYGGAYGYVIFALGHVREEQRSRCPSRRTAPLTDRPFPLFLVGLPSGVEANALPEGAAWLVAAEPPPAATPARGQGPFALPAQPEFPYHARFRGHLGDPRFAHCADAERILVVDEVVGVYEPTFDTVWRQSVRHSSLAIRGTPMPRVEDIALDLSLAHPEGWRVERADRMTFLVRSPEWPDWPVVVRVSDGVTGEWRIEPVFQRAGWRLDTPRLVGRFQTDCAAGSGERCHAAYFKGNGRTYELMLRYPIGFEAPQDLISGFGAMIDRLGIHGMPTRTPTPPVQTALDGEPYWTREQVEEQARGMLDYGPWRFDSVRLVPEAEARQLNLCYIDGLFEGGDPDRHDTRAHPDGVWIVRQIGNYAGQPAVYNTYLGATDGYHLCTADEATRR